MVVVSNDPGPRENPSPYYRPGPSSGSYPQYPQNPYPQGWRPGAAPAPFPQQPPTPGYDPHLDTGPPPAGLPAAGTAPVSRPRQVTSALLLLLTATLPFLLMGVTAMFATVNDELLDQAGIPRAELDAMMAQTGLTTDALTQAVRVMGGVFLVLALAYAGVAVAAFLGQAWARVVLVVLTALYGLPLLLMMAPTLPLFAVAVLALAVTGLWLLFSPPAKTWYAARAVRGGAPGRAG